MWFFIAVLSAILFGLAGLFMKVSQMRKGSHDYLLLGLYVSGTIGFFIHAWVEGTLVWNDWRIWLSGLIIGAGSAWGNVVFMKALDYGPASLTSPLTNLNIVLVIFMSTAFYGETLGAAEIGGIALLLVAVALISIRGKEPLSVTQKRWYGYVALGVILFSFRNGGLKVTGELGLNNTPILFISYLLSILWFAYVIYDKRQKTRPVGSTGRVQTDEPPLKDGSARTGLLWGLLTGIFSYAGLQMYTVALDIGKANVVAPIFSTNSLVIAIGSILLFKERLTRLQLIALLCLLIGLILVRF